MLLPVLKPFFLVGGTALALQLGHRKSIDLDLFTPEPFNNSSLVNALATDFEVSIELEELEDAEQSANPVVFDELVTWKKVKASINKAVKNMG